VESTTVSLIELGVVFFGLGVLGHFASKISLSPVPLYLLGGLVLGEGGFVEFAGVADFGHLASEIGVVLLLLMLGLEYTAKELVTGLRKSWLAGLVDLVLNMAPGVLVALLLGWGAIGALVMAGVTYISSSGIVAKVLTDLGRLGNRETPVILSILVIEDLTMALYLPITAAVLAGVSFVGGIVALAVILLTALRYGRIVSGIIDSPDRESFLLKLIGAALLVAGIASSMQISAAVGAFLLGIAISGVTATNATRVLEPLRDVFAAMFFFVFGLNTDPTAIPPVLGIALALAVTSAATKYATGWWAAKQHRIGPLGRARAGTALIARGEFSIVIAGLAVASGAVDEQLAPLAATYVLLLAVIGPIATRVVEPLMRGLRARTIAAPVATP
jgi:CPA2 family monovalent cation:H+ antiporter-2